MFESFEIMQLFLKNPRWKSKLFLGEPRCVWYQIKGPSQYSAIPQPVLRLEPTQIISKLIHSPAVGRNQDTKVIKRGWSFTLA